MRKVLLNGDIIEPTTDILPTLIHGNEGSGASLYTIILAANYYSAEHNILFLCGYPMAEEEFLKEVGGKYANAKFFTKDKYYQFIKVLNDGIDAKTVVFVKNIELFDGSLLEKLKSIQNLVISGDLDKSPLKKSLLAKKFTTEIYFSNLEGKALPRMEKYIGYVLSAKRTGPTSIL